MKRLYHILRLLIILPLAGFVLSLAVSNAETVNVSLYPLPYEVMLPKYLLMLGMTFFGFIIGWLVTLNSALRWRFVAREQSRKVDALHNELASLKAEQRDKLPKYT
ncbi:MAG: LapA family protein [Alphaproteobacteria bacterium]|nr:LapA family protein [Alphaproteobacteria bacterium]